MSKFTKGLLFVLVLLFSGCTNTNGNKNLSDLDINFWGGAPEQIIIVTRIPGGKTIENTSSIDMQVFNTETSDYVTITRGQTFTADGYDDSGLIYHNTELIDPNNNKYEIRDLVQNEIVWEFGNPKLTWSSLTTNAVSYKIYRTKYLPHTTGLLTVFNTGSSMSFIDEALTKYDPSQHNDTDKFLTSYEVRGYNSSGTEIFRSNIKKEWMVQQLGLF